MKIKSQIASLINSIGNILSINNKKVPKKQSPLFQINIMENEFENYIKECEKNKNQRTSYYKNIYKPIKKHFLKRCEFGAGADYYIHYSKADIKDLKNIVNLIRIEKVKKVITDAYEKCNGLLQSEGIEILILPLLSGYINEGLVEYGALGFSAGNGKIIILLNPTKDNWEQKLAYTIAHEYHHSIWTKTEYDKSRFNLLEYLLFEGKAESFARMIYPNIVLPWIDGVSVDHIKLLYNHIKDQLDSVDGKLFRVVMFERVGYALGYDMMQKYININENLCVGDWTKSKSEDIVKKYNF